MAKRTMSTPSNHPQPQKRLYAAREGVSSANGHHQWFFSTNTPQQEVWNMKAEGNAKHTLRERAGAWSR